MTTPEYTLDDITSDAAHLYELIDVVTDTAIGTGPTDFPTPEDHAKWNAARLVALLWIARDLSEKIKAGLDNLPPMEPRTSPGGQHGSTIGL